jgi:transketolase
VTSSLGLALGAADYYGSLAPRVHIVEGEGGMTPGRVQEALAAAGTASLWNTILHIDWNQASIDSDQVCRDGREPGEYVQWDPVELAYLHDWNVIFVPDGKDLQQVVAAQRRALTLDTGQPTAIVYRTIKGWHYGMEGKVSHGAGHALCSEGFHQAVAPFLKGSKETLPACEKNQERCEGGKNREVMEECFWEALGIVRDALKENRQAVEMMADRLKAAKRRLDGRARKPRKSAPLVEKVFEIAEAGEAPSALEIGPGKKTTLRATLGMTLNHYNKESGGALLAAAADLLDSTSIGKVASGMAEGRFNARTNPEARLMTVGGICEDAIAGMLSGISTFGRHIGIGSSYAAFMAALGHVSARLHAIGSQARKETFGDPHRTFFLVCAHAGLKTGEDGPTHADPQALQLLQENFPRGTMVTLTPWDPQEIWPLVSRALACRPAVIAPFVTRPTENVLDRPALGLAPAQASVKGFYRLRAAKEEADGVVVLQGSGVTYAFVEQALPLIEKEGLDLNVYYVSSAELFDALPESEREGVFPEEHARQAMGITGFTLPTLYRWVRSERGRNMSLHPFVKGHFLGSGQADLVLAEAGLDGESQFEAVMRCFGKGG